MTQEDAERWAQELAEVMGRIGARFGRVEPRRRALAYLRACSRRWSARTVGSWPKPQVIAHPTGYRTFWPGRSGRPIWCAMIWRLCGRTFGR